MLRPSRRPTIRQSISFDYTVVASVEEVQQVGWALPTKTLWAPFATGWALPTLRIPVARRLLAIQVIVRRVGQEVGELLVEDEGVENLGGVF